MSEKFECEAELHAKKQTIHLCQTITQQWLDIQTQQEQ